MFLLSEIDLKFSANHFCANCQIIFFLYTVRAYLKEFGCFNYCIYMSSVKIIFVIQPCLRNYIWKISLLSNVKVILYIV